MAAQLNEAFDKTNNASSLSVNVRERERESKGYLTLRSMTFI
jgi:hypothetical protein